MKASLKAKFHQRTLWKWIFSYGLIVLLCLTVSAGLNHMIVRELEKEVLNSNTALLSQARVSIDGFYTDAENLTNTILVNQKIDIFLNRRSPDNIYYYSNYEAFEEIKKYTWAKGAIDFFVLYNGELDKAITPMGIFSKQQLYTSLFHTTDLSYEQFSRVFTSNTGWKQVQMQINNDLSSGSKILFTANLGNSRSPGNAIVMQIDVNKLLDTIKSINLPGVQGLILLNEDDSLLCTNVENAPVYLSSPEWLGTLYEQGVVSIDGENQAIYLPSYVNGMKYLLVVSDSISQKKIAFIQLISALTILLCLAFSTLLVYVFSRRNYAPLGELVNTLTAKTNSSRDNMDEFSYVHASVRDALMENTNMKAEIAGYKDVLRNNVLGKLLKGKDSKSFQYEKALAYFRVPFHGNYYVACLFHIREYGIFYAENAKDQELIRFILRNVSCEVLQLKEDATAFEIDGLEALVINIDSPSAVENAGEKLQTALCILKKYYNLSVTVAIGGVHETLTALSQSYYEALEVLEYQEITGNTRVRAYNALYSLTDATCAYSYSIEQEQKLILCVRAGNVEGALKIIYDVLCENIGENTPLTRIRCIISDLFCTVLKALNEISKLSRDEQLLVTVPYEIINSVTQPQEICQAFAKWLSAISQRIDTRKGSKKVFLFEDIQEFIVRNFSRSELNIELTAQHFEMNPIYISKVFKENTGMGILDFIGGLRIEKAKELLKDKDINIGEIAVQCGYYSHATFTRSFKKMTGITPTVFREMYTAPSGNTR